jgi:hypothetical protein
MAQRMKKVSGSRQPICRRCVLDKAESGELKRLHCRDCNRDIEPGIVKRILRARKWGRIVPLLCKNCFTKRRPRRRRKQPPLPPPEAPPVVYPVVYTTGDTTSSVADDDDDEPIPLDVDEWECMTCAAPLEPDEVNDIRYNRVVECEYCGSSCTADQYR